MIQPEYNQIVGSASDIIMLMHVQKKENHKKLQRILTTNIFKLVNKLNDTYIIEDIIKILKENVCILIAEPRLLGFYIKHTRGKIFNEVRIDHEIISILQNHTTLIV